LSQPAGEQGHRHIIIDKDAIFKSVLGRVHCFVIEAKLVLATLAFVVAVVLIFQIDLTVAFDVAQEV